MRSSCTARLCGQALGYGIRCIHSVHSRSASCCFLSYGKSHIPSAYRLRDMQVGLCRSSILRSLFSPHNSDFFSSTNRKLIHSLFKSEHSIWKLLITFLNVHFWLIRVRMKFIKKFNNMKSASIYIKVYITLFKIRCYSPPNFYFWM